MIKELVQLFLVSLVVMGILFVLVGLVRYAMKENVPLSQVPQLIPFVMLEMSPVAVPMALLLSVSLFFARMAGNNEIVALKSLGIHPYRVLFPVIVFGLLISLLTVWMNEMAIWGRSCVSTVIYHAAEEIILGKLRTTHSLTSPDGSLNIVVKGVENKKLIMPSITVKSGGEPTTIEAQSAQLNINFESQELIVTLIDVKLDVRGEIRYLSDNQVFKHQLSKIIPMSDSNSGLRPSDMPLVKIPKELIENNNEILNLKRTIAFHYAFAGAMGAADGWANPETRRLSSEIDTITKLNNRLQVEPPRRWATGFSCICFIILGAPFAIWLGQKGISDGFSSFFACFIPILLFYYPLLMLGLQKAKHGTLPPNSVWIANFCLVIASIWFLRKIHRY
jgi:lipopolysaccharide export system permease protein